MKSVRLEDLRALLESAAFGAWWTEWQRATSALEDARHRRDDLTLQAELMGVRSDLAQRAAADAFARSGEADDAGTRWAAGAQEEENRALALVARYEEQRTRTSELWARLGAAEKAVEDRREAVGGDPTRMREVLESALREAERERDGLAAGYEAADRERRRLWEEAEGAWAAAFERSLLAAEHRIAAKRVRREAERLIAEGEERRARARRLSADAEEAGRVAGEVEARLDALRASARDRFGCAPGPSFLYWRHAGDERSAFAVALSDDPGGGGAPVKALQVHVVGRQGGVSHLEVGR
jgi:hypothetical protein